MREITTIVTHEVDGEEKQFQIQKLDALEGSVLLKFVVQKFVPLFRSIDDVFAEPEVEEGKDVEAAAKEVAAQRTIDLMSIIPKALETISNEELIDFEKRCLRRVQIMYAAGWQPVMKNNSFGCDEVQYDPFLALLLCWDVVRFNYSGFFDGKGLSSALKSLNTPR
ncbi:MAG: hypothetical protein J6X39_00100 [Bacteroidales bacterium]|nr:hypothetical protein [Bacteroidales bacterium]